MIKQWWVEGPEDLASLVPELLDFIAERRVICFHGDLGAGKTTLIKSICLELGVLEEVQSPSFSIVNEYLLPGGEPVYHFDFYRLKSEEEAYDLGYENYFFSGYFCFIEWPEKVGGLLNLKKADIFIEPLAGKRHIRCEL
ncbi:MAG: tRNA (adenosine(37)-N6)-threonylcarbamoyltransferase complex ATPase subunit type 1 TsaE [Bacteroidia bacterium]|nr:tRNA (adenosine(37)-N6)-threonylcarbamoyltransferase complex ATPase subunit type 1 TsaE [Bacteroidia bacterium]